MITGRRIPTTFVRRATLLGAVLLLAGCGGGGGGGKSNEGFLAGLESHGIDVTAPQPEPPGILEVSSTVYQLPGGVLHVFTFPDGQAAKTAAARVQPGGYMVQNTMGINQAVDWSAPPHWYRSGRGLAVYLGSSSKVTDALTEIAGPQFAGA
jgi:hypothetical protein